MLRLSFIFFFKISIGYKMSMPVKSWNPLQRQLQSQKRYWKQSVHFWSPLKLSWFGIFSVTFYLAKNSERKLRYQLSCFLENDGLWKLESTTGQLGCLKLKSLYSVGYVHTTLGTKSSTLEHMSARHSLADCFRNRANITGRVLSYVSTEALRYGFRASAKAILACMLWTFIAF